MFTHKMRNPGRVGKWIFLLALGLGSAAALAELPAQEKNASLPPAVLDGPENTPVSATAQEKEKDKKDLPVLPPTKVPGEVTPPTTDQPFPEGPPPSAGAPLSSGGVFSSPPTSGYLANSSTSGGKIDIPLVNFPGSVAVTTRDTMNDQQAFSLNDILRNLGAISTSDGPNFRDSFVVRGFENNSTDNRWNGFLDPFTPYRDLQNIERVELLKGPSSGLYGAGQPSGLINYITKKPLDDSFANYNVTVGSFALFRTTLDVNEKLNESGTLLFRLNVAYLNQQDSFRDDGFLDRTQIAPSFTWLIDDGLSLNIDAAYQRDRRSLDTGLVSNGLIGASPSNLVASIPNSRYLGNPGDWNQSDDYKISAQLFRQIGENWTARLGFFTTWNDNPFFGTTPFDTAALNNLGIYAAPPGTVARQTDDVTVNHQTYYSIMADLNGKFETGILKHNLLIGTEIGWLRSNFLAQVSDPLSGTFVPPPFAPPPGFIFTSPNPSTALNVINPVYTGPGALVGNVRADLQQERNGFYAQDLIDVGEHFKIFGGVRGDIVHQFSDLAVFEPIAGNSGVSPLGVGTQIPLTQNEQTFYHMSPRVGLMYQPIPETVSFYGSYGLSFDPPTSGLFPGPIVPETGQTVEGGMRMSLLDKKLLIAATGFYIVKEHVVTQDPTNFLFNAQIGKERSQGGEFSVTGKLTDRWSVIANYTYVDARVLQGVDPNNLNPLTGNFSNLSPNTPIRNVPHNNANIWTRFNFIQDGCQTAGIAAGMVYVGERGGDLQDSFSLGSYTRFDGGLFYQKGWFNASLYLENIFNKSYILSSFNDSSVLPGAPFTIRGTVGVVF